MAALRLGAVGYLNARPLTWALDRAPGRWRIDYDVPAVCAARLHGGDVDLALVPSIDYLQAADYRIVPGVGIGSRGPVASVALFAREPMARVRRIALDTSSRTSVTLVRVLCRRHFDIAPAYVPHAPDLAAMLETCEAALLIGDPALETDHDALGLLKIDLGEAWTAMTGLPFVYAAWTGRAGAAGSGDVRALQEAQAEGVGAADAIAAEYGGARADRVARAAAYLRHNVRYGLGPDEAAGLQLFLDQAAGLGLAPRRRDLDFF